MLYCQSIVFDLYVHCWRLIWCSILLSLLLYSLSLFLGLDICAFIYMIAHKCIQISSNKFSVPILHLDDPIQPRFCDKTAGNKNNILIQVVFYCMIFVNLHIILQISKQGRCSRKGCYHNRFFLITVVDRRHDLDFKVVIWSSLYLCL